MAHRSIALGASAKYREREPACSPLRRGAPRSTGSSGSAETNITAQETTKGISPWLPVIESTTGYSANPPHEGFREGVFDLRQYAGETVRMRIYDTATGGWGHINVDSIEVTSQIPESSSTLLSLLGISLLLFRRRR